MHAFKHAQSVFIWGQKQASFSLLPVVIHSFSVSPNCYFKKHAPESFDSPVDVSVLQNFQAGCGAHPASSSVGIQGSCIGCKAADV